MTAFYWKYLTQKATWWSRGDPDGYGGYTFSYPKVIDVRWEDKAVQLLSPTGEERISRSIVWVKETDNVKIGDFLYLGQTAEADPTKLAGAYEVQEVRRTPSVDGKKIEVRCFL